MTFGAITGEGITEREPTTRLQEQRKTLRPRGWNHAEYGQHKGIVHQNP